MPEQPEGTCNPVLLLRRFFDEQHADRIGLAATAVWFCLLRHADNTGLSYPSYSALGLECGLSTLGVRKAIDNLLGAQMVKIERKGSSHKSALYRISLPLPATELHKHSLINTVLENSVYETQLPSLCNSVTPKVPNKKPSRVHVPPTPAFDDVDVELTNTLRDLNRTRIPEWNFAGKQEKHYHEMHLLRTRGNANNDNKPVADERIRAVLTWLTTDDFWIPKGNVQSVSKFREKFLQFEMKAATQAKPNGKHFTPAVPGSIPEQTYSYQEPPAALLTEWQAGLEKLRARFVERGGSVKPEERLASLAGLTPISRNGDGILRIGARDRNTAKFAREYYHDDLAAVFGAVAIEP